MNSEQILMLVLDKRWVWTLPYGKGGSISYFYDDRITWAVVALAAAWITWQLIQKFLRDRKLRRPPGRSNHRLLKRIIKTKRELSSQYLQPGFSSNIHAVGIGKIGNSNAYCIQIFVSDVKAALWPGTATLPATHRGVPLVLIEMPVAAFLSAAVGGAPVSTEHPGAIRGHQETIIGGISGANTNLTGQSGTIGYFCTRKSNLRRRKDIYLLSNSHVFADLRKTKVDEGDLIMQPSPGEPASNRPIGVLVKFSPLRFDGQTSEPNYIDAAIAKLWNSDAHKPLIPSIGAVKGYVPKKNVEIGEATRKFGRTTGYTEGQVFSIYLDIWIRYDRTGKSAFFGDQILIAPAAPAFQKFVAKGDSGSLLVDAHQHAVGLIFGGMSEIPGPASAVPVSEPAPTHDPAKPDPQRIEGYGVANPISEVMDGLRIELLV